ncbi:MAG: AAA family ATPase [Oscillospiraceae bacterium]|nr:AAA family ATPase [Oscillospiraceae bacterium]
MYQCGLLGRKLAHSYSPDIHKAFGGYDYNLYEAEPENLERFLQTIAMDKGFLGLNVTIPYKQTVISFCKELSPTAMAIGSVNTLLPLPSGGFYGANTDVAGFVAMISALSQLSGFDVAGKKVLVLGSGGSSRTVHYVLEQHCAKEIVTISRSGEHNYQNLHKHENADVIVNTTPVGMYPDTEESPIDLSIFLHLEGVLDLIYNPARTQLLTDAAEWGIPCVGGLVMLIEQAAAASALFTGKTVSPEKCKDVLSQLSRSMENVVLIGMPGCGKSTVGRALAKQMGRPFVDIDEEVAAMSGCSIPEIFERVGEAGFREKEADAIKQWGKQSGNVIATGGGCVTRMENFFSLRQNSIVIFLERELGLLARDGRPLSQGDIDVLYKQRLPLYRRFADRAIQNDAELSVVVNNILSSF